MSPIRPVVLSGGAGTRLWPLSTMTAPKQFAGLIKGPSLFERTLLRLDGRPDVSPPFVVTGIDHLDSMVDSAGQSGVELDLILVEPEGRNTAPACVAAALAAAEDEVLVIVPSDHLIRDTEGYASHVETAAAHARNGEIVTFGIKPTAPETGFGYIELGDVVGSAHRVARFKEKPDRVEAERMLADGGHVWNSGIFIATAGRVIEEAAVHCPDILEAVRASLRPVQDGVLRLGEEFATSEKISFDHAIMEKTARAVVIPIGVGWDDVGSFQAIWSVSDKDGQGNVIDGDVALVGVDDSLIWATTRRVAVAGMSGVVVVETEDAVLVVPKDRSQLVKDLVEKQAETG